ncbi:MAG: DUF1048 domain-containing protein [Clostridiales bacterium]|nr:DUF1048 domain-containing protein [Clostridiales bacterium]
MKDSYAYYKDRLEGEYYQTFDRIELYCVSQGMDDDSQERLLGELLDMFLTAQQAGRPVKRIVGGDLEEFCRQFCSGLGWKSRGIDTLNNLASCAKWMLAFTALELVCNLEEAALPDLQTDVSGYIIGWGIGLFVSLLVGMAVKGLMFRWKRISMGVYNGLLLGALAVLVAAVLLLPEAGVPLPVLSLPMWAVLAGCGGYLVVYYAVWGWWRRAHNIQPPQKVKLIDLVTEELPKDLLTQYEQKNQRRLRRGKPPITPEEYTEKMRRRNRIDRRFRGVWWWLLVAGYACLVVWVAMDSALADTLVFAAILCAIAFVNRKFFRYIDQVTDWWTEVLKVCDRNGVTAIEYFQGARLHVVEGDAPEES